MSETARKIKLNFLQRRAIKELAKGGTVADAMRRAGYKESMARNPQKLTNSKAFVKVLERAGLTDNLLSKKHLELTNSARIERLSFPAIDKTVKKKGKKKLQYIYQHVPDEQIKAQIESVPGHVLMYIQKGTREKVAYFRVPENVVVSKAIEMGYKVKGHFAAEQLELVEHEMTPEEAALYAGIKSKNKK